MATRVEAIAIAGPVVRSDNALAPCHRRPARGAHAEGAVTQFVANLIGSGQEPVAWACCREAEGWDGIGVADHLWARTTPFLHWAVTLGQMAAVTERVTLQVGASPTTCSAPRWSSPRPPSPSSRTRMAASRPGWAQDGRSPRSRGFAGPAAGERVDRYVEAVTIVGSLLRTRQCSFAGRHYQVEVPVLGPVVDRPPPLVVSVGGPRTIREVAPLADRVELAFNGAATRANESPARLAELGGPTWRTW